MEENNKKIERELSEMKTYLIAQIRLQKEILMEIKQQRIEKSQL